MKVRLVLTKHQALTLVQVLCAHYAIELKPEWFSKAYAHDPEPLLNFTLPGIPAALAQPEGWRERLRLIYQRLTGRRA